MNKKFEYIDDNPGSYFGMLVEGWEELNESNVEYIKWVQLPNKKWKMWGSSSSSKLDSDFLDKARKQNDINYLDAKISKNGEYPEGVSEEDIYEKHRFTTESLKEDKFVSRDKMSKKDRKELDSQKRGTWGNTNPVTRVQPNKKAYDRKRDKKIVNELLSDFDYKNGERFTIKANKIDGLEFDEDPGMIENVFNAIGDISFNLGHIINTGSESSTYVVPSVLDIKDLIKNDGDFNYFFKTGQLEFVENEALEESVLNESSDGWDRDKLEELIELLDRLYDLRYEVTSTIRGAYTNCKTYEELGRYVSELAEGLDSVGTDITLIDEDEEDEEEDLSSYGMESGYYN